MPFAGRFLLLVVLCASFLGPGCQKRDVKHIALQSSDTALVGTTCKAVLYGMATVFGPGYADTSLTISDVNKQSGKKTDLFPYGNGSCYANHATIMDGTYAILLPNKWNGNRPAKTILRYKPLASSTYYDIALDSTVVGLAANAANHTFYAVAYGPGINDTLISFRLSGGAMLARQSLGVFQHFWASPPSLAVDEQTNTVYIAGTAVNSSGSSGGTVIYRYTSGSGIMPVAGANPAGYNLIGLSFNPNDRNVYAIDESSAANLLRIDPQAGITTVVATLPERVNNEFYSVAFEKCSDRLYISSKGQASSGFMTVCDLVTGKYGHYHLPYFYQGLALTTP